MVEGVSSGVLVPWIVGGAEDELCWAKIQVILQMNFMMSNDWERPFFKMSTGATNRVFWCDFFLEKGGMQSCREFRVERLYDGGEDDGLSVRTSSRR